QTAITDVFMPSLHDALPIFNAEWMIAVSMNGITRSIGSRKRVPRNLSRLTGACRRPWNSNPRTRIAGYSSIRMMGRYFMHRSPYSCFPWQGRSQAAPLQSITRSSPSEADAYLYAMQRKEIEGDID